MWHGLVINTTQTRVCSFGHNISNFWEYPWPREKRIIHSKSTMGEYILSLFLNPMLSSMLFGNPWASDADQRFLHYIWIPCPSNAHRNQINHPDYHVFPSSHLFLPYLFVDSFFVLSLLSRESFPSLCLSCFIRVVTEPVSLPCPQWSALLRCPPTLMVCCLTIITKQPNFWLLPLVT